MASFLLVNPKIMPFLSSYLFHIKIHSDSPDQWNSCRLLETSGVLGTHGIHKGVLLWRWPVLTAHFPILSRIEMPVDNHSWMRTQSEGACCMAKVAKVRAKEIYRTRNLYGLTAWLQPGYSLATAWLLVRYLHNRVLKFPLILYSAWLQGKYLYAPIRKHKK